METLNAAWAWILVHWPAVLGIAVYVIVNVVPRKHPDEQSGWRKLFWLVLDRISLLTADKVPGSFKMFLAATPRSELGLAPAKSAEKKASDKSE